MARFEHRSTFEAPVTSEDAQRAVVAYFSSLGARVKATTPNYVEASTGSQVALRGKGAAFANKSEYPMRTSVAVEPVEGGARVSVTCVDEVGVGIKVGLRKGYESEFRNEVRSIKSAVSNAIPTPAESPGTTSLTKELSELAALHQDGVLSDEEFAAAKQRVLGGE